MEREALLVAEPRLLLLHEGPEFIDLETDQEPEDRIPAHASEPLKRLIQALLVCYDQGWPQPPLASAR